MKDPNPLVRALVTLPESSPKPTAQSISTVPEQKLERALKNKYLCQDFGDSEYPAIKLQAFWGFGVDDDARDITLVA